MSNDGRQLSNDGRQLSDDISKENKVCVLRGEYCFWKVGDFEIMSRVTSVEVTAVCISSSVPV